MRVVLAPDSFKESMTAAQAAAAMAAGVRRVLPGAQCVEVPMADGGEGTTAAMVAALGGLQSGTLVVGPADGAVMPPQTLLAAITNVHEAAAVGTIFPAADGTPRLHMHAAMGRAEEARTGCVRPGLDVWKIFEVVIIELTGLDLARAKDPETGFELLGRASTSDD